MNVKRDVRKMGCGEGFKGGLHYYILTFIKWEKQLNGRVAMGSGRI